MASFYTRTAQPNIALEPTRLTLARRGSPRTMGRLNASFVVSSDKAPLTFVDRS
jgi:hypothetical protein